jgi:hypothetical protein
MKIIQENPYRLIGILSNTTAKEIQSRKGKISAYAKVGKQINSDYDFPFLDIVERDINKIDKAFAAIQQSKEMLNNSLFWFLNKNSFDETAISYLKNGDKEKAIEIWEKITSNKDVNSKNYSCFNNIGTIKLLSPSITELKEGIEAKIKLINSEYFTDFVHSVAGEAFVFDNQSQLEYTIDILLKQLKDKFTNMDLISFFENCNSKTQNFIASKFTDEPLHKIETAIELTKKKRNKDRNSAFKEGLKLYDNTKIDLEILKSLLDLNDLKYKLVADNLAKEIMQCGIDYFNESQENEISEDFLENAMQLNKLADSIAVGKLTKDKVKDNISTLEEMKEKVINNALTLLKSIKKAYEENKKKIEQQVKDLESDREIIFGLKTINRRAVEEGIKNSIDWTKVNVLLQDMLTDNNLAKIKKSENQNNKNQFFELLEWLKLTSSKSSKISIIIEKYKKIPPKLPFKIYSSEITNTDNNPLYNKYIRYVGLNLKIEVFENKSVEFQIKFIKPNGNVYSDTKGYTYLNNKKLNVLKKSIQLSGWGNPNKSIFEIGQNRIELYVDEYLIHKKDFYVELAPSEVIEKQLKIEEEKLKRIRTTIYFENELKSLRNEMVEINKFHLFRLSSVKQRQIENQQNKINELKKKAEIQEAKDIKQQEEKIRELKNKLSKAKY